MTSPSDHGYALCTRCGCWTRRPAVLAPTREVVCADVAWCGNQAGVGRGELDLDPPEVEGEKFNTLEVET